MSDRISRMANQLDGLDELLAGMYEILKRHEQILIDLTVDVEGLKANQTGHDQDLFEAAKARARFAIALGSEAQSRLYDETIRKLRGK